MVEASFAELLSQAFDVIGSANHLGQAFGIVWLWLREEEVAVVVGEQRQKWLWWLAKRERQKSVT